jgi:hypothetical protein
MQQSSGHPTSIYDPRLSQSWVRVQKLLQRRSIAAVYRFDGGNGPVIVLREVHIDATSNQLSTTLYSRLLFLSIVKSSVCNDFALRGARIGDNCHRLAISRYAACAPGDYLTFVLVYPFDCVFVELRFRIAE